MSYEKIRNWLRKGNFNRETESLYIAAENNAIRTTYIKTIIDKTQQNSSCWLCVDRDEIINRITECSSLAHKEYKTRHDWVDKVIHWDTGKKLKLDRTSKCYMHNPASLLQNDTHEFFCDFDIQLDHQISTRRPDIIIIIIIIIIITIIIIIIKCELGKLWTLLSWLTTE